MVKEKKHKTFGEFILNDDKIVMKFLITTSKWFGVIIFTGLTLLFIFARMWVFGVVFGIFAILAIRNLYKFYKLGGSKNLEGLTASELVWNKTKN